MLTSLVLASTLSAGPTFISDVRATLGAERLVVEVTAESPLSAANVSSDLSGKHLFVYVTGTYVRKARRAWGEGRDTIRAHRHAAYTELDIPLPASGACAGGVSVETTAGGGVRATLKCPGLATAGAASEAPVAAVAPKPTTAQELRDVVAIAPAAPPTKARPEKTVSPVVVVALKPAPVAAAPIASASASAIKESKVVATLPGASAPAATTTPAVQPAPTTTAGTAADLASFRVVATPIAGVLLLSGAALFLRRRKHTRGRLVRIIETASLGPKRALIVAEIGGERMVLGASEAGITLLGGGIRGVHLDASSEVHGPSEPVAIDGNRHLDTPGAVATPVETSAGQVKFLAQFFSRKPKLSTAALGSDDGFQSLFEDSLEDQDLRRKLAAGHASRVP